MRARFVNESQKEGSLFRNTGEGWLIDFLDKGYVEKDEFEEPPKFISFSRDDQSGSMDKFGHIQIEFDEKKVFDQGAIEIYYEPEFFEQYPDISRYVTGFYDKWDYYDNLGIEDSDAAHAEHELDWKDNIEGYEHEEEIVSRKLKLVPGLIKKVVFDKSIYEYQKPDKYLIELLEKNKIPYELPKVTSMD